MHILILTPGFPSLEKAGEVSYGGEFILAEAEAYVSAGAQVTILTPHIHGLPEIEQVNEHFQIVRFRYFYPSKWQVIRSEKPIYAKQGSIFKLLQMPFFIAAFIFYIGRYMRQVDIVHANWTPTALLALPFQWIMRTPVVLTYRGSDLRLLPVWLNKFITRHVSGVLDIWGDTAWAIEKRALFPAHWIPLPIITRIASHSEKIDMKEDTFSPSRFALIGRLSSIGDDFLKGGSVIIPASWLVKEKHKDFSVDIVGDGQDWDMLQKQRVDTGMECQVTMHGFQFDVFPFIKQSVAVIGGIGLNAVAQEAAYSKVLLIMPDVQNYNGSIWVHQKNTLLYEPRNAASLAEAMLFVIEHPDEVKKIALEGYKTIRKYVVAPEEGGSLYVRAFQTLISK